MIKAENYKIEAGDSSNDYWYSTQPKAQRILQSAFEPTCFALKCKSNSHLMYKCSQESLGLFNAEDLFRKNIHNKKPKGANESMGFFQVENKTKANVRYGAINSNKLRTTSSSSKELLIPLTAGRSKSIDIAMIVKPTDDKEIQHKNINSNNGQHDQKYQNLQRNSSMNSILDKDFNEDKQSLLTLKNSCLSLPSTPLSNSLRSSQNFFVDRNASHLRQRQKLVHQKKELQSNTTLQVKWVNEIENNNLVLHENIYESSNTSLDQSSIQNKNKFPNREKENHETTDYFHISKKNSQFPEKYKRLPELKEEIKKVPFLSELFIGTDLMENSVTKITTGVPSYGCDVMKSKEMAHEKFGIISETVASNEQDFHKLKMKYDALQLPNGHRCGPETNVEGRGILGKMWSVLQNLCEENQNSQVIKLQGDDPAILFDKQGFPITDLKGRLLRTKNGEFLLKLSCCKQQIGTSLPIFDAEGTNIGSIEFDSRKRPAILKTIKVMDLVKKPAELYDRRGHPLTDEEGFVLYNSKGTTLVKLDRKSFPICCNNGSPIYLKNGTNWLTQRCKFIIRTFPNLSMHEKNTRNQQSRLEENMTDEKNPNLQLSRVPQLEKSNSSQLPPTAGRIPFLANMIFDMINKTSEQDTYLNDYYNTVYNASGEALTDETGFPLSDENGDSLILHNEEGEAISDQFGEPLYNYEGEQITNGWIEIEEYYGESYYEDDNTLQVGQYPLQGEQSIYSHQNRRPIIPKRQIMLDWKLYNDHRQPLPKKVVSFTQDEWDNTNETYGYEGRERRLMGNPYQYNYLTTQTLGHRIHFQN